jgi:riboflavin kinase/FMN adenylyltransferase
MKVISGLPHIHGLSLALGFFDGIHTGHAIVIKNAVKYAKSQNAESGIVLFRNHPKEFFTGEKIEHIITFDDKITMFNRLGVDYVFLLDFNKDFATLSPQDYMENVIMPYCQPIAITTGFNHTFGFNGAGTPKLLEQYSKDFGFKYFQVPPITTQSTLISSTNIRQAIKSSNFDLVRALLGYNFYIKSPVVHGRKIGRTINFPTANLIYPNDIVKIERGVYFVTVSTNRKRYKGVMNYGLRPTVEKGDVVDVPEVHLLDYSGNLYGNIVKVSIIAKIRDERPFKSLEELKNQITKDCNFAQNYKIKRPKLKKTILLPEQTKVPVPDFL